MVKVTLPDDELRMLDRLAHRLRGYRWPNLILRGCLCLAVRRLARLVAIALFGFSGSAIAR